jgi:NADH-quinone oxidoreductase subunit N
MLPEIVLILAATLMYVLGAFARSRVGWGAVALGSLALAGGVLIQQQFYSANAQQLSDGFLSGPIIIDDFTFWARWLALAVGGISILTLAYSARGPLAAERMASLVLLVAGLMLIAASADLVLLFLGLELVSLPTYVLLYLGRKDAEGQESAMKYFFLSILSSGLLLYGITFVYGAAGSTDMTRLVATLGNHVGALRGAAEMQSAFAHFALLLIFAGIGFRLTAVPFHFYAPDVYQGQSNGNAGLLAVAPKVAGLAALARLVVAAMPGIEGAACSLMLVVAAITMTLGNIMALWQHNIRRMLAYSSIAQAGYMLIGVAITFAVERRSEFGAQWDANQSAVDYDGLGSTLFYLVAYAAATLGIFAALSYLSSANQRIDTLDDMAGVGQTHPRIGIALAIFLMSLAGLPPLAGFWGKFTLVLAALGVDAKGVTDPNAAELLTKMHPWFVGLAIIAVLNAAVSAAYYLRIIAAMYFKPSGRAPQAEGGWPAALATGLCVVALVAISIHPQQWLGHANDASDAVQTSFTKVVRAQKSNLGAVLPGNSPVVADNH